MSTIPQRRSRTQEYDLEEDDSYYTERPRTSSVRYTQPRQQVIQRGNKRIVIHNAYGCSAVMRYPGGTNTRSTVLTVCHGQHNTIRS